MNLDVDVIWILGLAYDKLAYIYELFTIMKRLFLILIFFTCNQLCAQEMVALKDLYIENGLTYKKADNKLFSGQGQKVRKNGHLVYEEFLEKGYRTKSIVYYNNTEKPIPARVTEFYEKSFMKMKETNYGLSEPTTEIIYFDESGKKKLTERYIGDHLTYRCEYLNNKKNGIEFCIDDDGNELEIEYRNGKKIKQR